jgi:Ni,Fe-hydrogenase I cytochrome b subunit
MEVERWTGRVTGGPLTDVYVYQAPVRIWHWVTMVCVIVLGVTGYLIGRLRRRASASRSMRSRWAGSG